MTTTADTRVVSVVHIGGPWDGQVEKRTIALGQTTARITQALILPPDDTSGRKPYLLHRYQLCEVGMSGTYRLVYKGYTPSDINGG